MTSIQALEATVNSLTHQLKQAERQRAAWEETAAQMHRNAAFYRGLVTQIGEMFGPVAKTADDGTVQEDVLALKVPELVRQFLRGYEVLKIEQACLLDESRRLFAPLADMDTRPPTPMRGVGDSHDDECGLSTGRHPGG